MRRLVAIALLGCALLSTPAQAATPDRSASDSPRFVDLTEAFDKAWNITQSLPDDLRAEAFEAEFAKTLPGFYSADRVKDFMTRSQYRELVLRGLKAYPERRAGIRRVSREFSSLAAPAQRQFQAVFGPMTGYAPIYLVNSLGEFDGGTRDLPEGSRLMFGVDVIDLLYRTTPIKPFIEHELFHLMHHRAFPECDSVWCNLWEEGLATYVASTLNPGASDPALGLTSPRPLRPAVEAHRQEALCAVRSRLNSKLPADYGLLFLGGGKPLSTNLPQRFGYYVGLMVLEDAGHAHNLKELAAMPPADARALVERTLDKLAACPAGAS
jgi:hypothetical protein